MEKPFDASEHVGMGRDNKTGVAGKGRVYMNAFNLKDRFPGYRELRNHSGTVLLFQVANLIFSFR